MSDAEQALWDSLGVSRDGANFEGMLIAELPGNRDLSTVSRIIDYREAAAQIRDELVADNLQAFFRIDDGTLGRTISANTWASDQGLEALYRGTAWIDEGLEEVCRFLLLAESKISDLVAAVSKQPCVDDPPKSAALFAAPATETFVDEVRATAPLPIRPKRGSTVEPDIISWLREKYPAGLPPTLPRKQLLKGLEEAGVKASNSSLQRAIGKARIPNDAK